LQLPEGWVAASPAEPMNLWLYGPPTPPFRANVSVLLDASTAPLAAYAAELAHRSAELRRSLDAAQRLRVAGLPALVVKGTPPHPRLKLRNVQALVDAGDRKVILTGTSVAEQFDG